jgi:hypothetical protein
LILGVMALSALFILPYSLPVYPPAKMVEYDRKQLEMGLDVMLKWEDGVVHDLPQDYADMVGWDELGEKAWTFYNSLSDSVKEQTLVYGENYGLAGAMRYFRPGPSYPEVYSFHDAFMMWIPGKPDFESCIYVGHSDRVPLYFENLELVGTVDDPYFRERGVPIWFGSGPTPKLWADWEETWQESAGQFLRVGNR